MTEINLQETFDKVATHLLRQGKKALDNKGYCVYRAGDDMCAVGCLITDEFYTAGLEGDNIHADNVRVALAHSLNVDVLDDDAITLIGALQDIHDDTQPDYWVSELRGLSEAFNLEWNHEE
jgi:hypothetical protein